MSATNEKQNEVRQAPAQQKSQSELMALIKSNLRSYMMYIALVIIMIIFTIGTKGRFLTGRNISDLIKQSGYVAILAIGMTIILIISHIDLSVGYVAGFSGAIAAILLTKGITIGSFHIGFNTWTAILVVLIIGALIGLYQGTLVTRIGVPAFVTTLAGQFIFRGLLARTLQSTGTIIIPNKDFNAISNGFIPDLPIGANMGIHVLTVLIGIVMVIAVIFTQWRERSNKLKYNFAVSSIWIFVAKIILFAVIIMAVIRLLALNNGIPWTAIIIAVVLLLYNFMLNETKLGRYIYGIGGNSQAAELSGINVKNVTLLAFISMSTLAALAGVLYTSRLQSATPQAGVGFELDAIASSYIGGVAVSGGIGRVTNTIVGVLVIMSLTNGMNLMQVDISYQYIVKGIIFIIAVAVDVQTRKRAR